MDLARSFPTRLAPLLLIAGALGGWVGCSTGSSGETSGPRGEPRPVARDHARAAVRAFLDSILDEDPKAFCATSLPGFREPGFAAFQVPVRPCVQRAAAMFTDPPLRGLRSSWAALAGASMGPLELHCGNGAPRCASATLVLEDVPQGRGDTANAPIPVKLVGGGWRVGGRLSH